MAQQGTSGEPPEYNETVDPENPPTAVTRPAVRRTAVWVFLGGITAVFLLVAAAFVYRSAMGPVPPADEVGDPSAVGTVGEETAGGGDPARDRDDPQDELEFRGAGEPPQGPMPGLAAPLTRVGAVLDASPRTVTGRRVEIENVIVERAEGTMFWIRDGDNRIAVIVPGDTATVRPGQRINLHGTVEADDRGVRIRATRVDVR
jgi:uncharacterized protein YdeI (BOF family)